MDNWSGASPLPSLYEAVKIIPRSHTYVFIGFTDEEKGDVGSSFYVRQMSDKAATSVRAMVNMDSLGLGPPKVWGSHSDTQLTAALAYLANLLNISLERVADCLDRRRDVCGAWYSTHYDSLAHSKDLGCKHSALVEG